VFIPISIQKVLTTIILEWVRACPFGNLKLRKSILIPLFSNFLNLDEYNKEFNVLNLSFGTVCQA
jgi:hypothetical protein